MNKFQENTKTGSELILLTSAVRAASVQQTVIVAAPADMFLRYDELGQGSLFGSHIHGPAAVRAQTTPDFWVQCC